jgi:hypothetical protein
MDDPKLTYDGACSSLYTLYKYIESITMASLNESISIHNEQKNYSAMIQSKYLKINWPLGYSLVDQNVCMSHHIITDEIDKTLINSSSLEFDLKKGLFYIDGSFEQSPYTFYPKKLCKTNEEIRQMINQYKEKYKSRRKETTLQGDTKRECGITKIAIIGFQQKQLYPYEKCEII